jgi:2-oxoglutarate ferredoxin oxidoreductase subunit beta
MLQHGKPMVFAGGKKGIKLNGLRPTVIELGDGLTADDCLVHDETDAFLASVIARMDYPDFPVPMGVIHRNASRAPYDVAFQAQIAEAKAALPPGQGAPDLGKLLRGNETWKVE